MFGFRSRVSEDMRSWIFDCFDWFDDRFEPPDQLVLPTRAFFQAPKGIGQDTAEQVLADIQRHMKIDQRIEIVPLDVLPGEYRLDYNALSSVAGAYDNSAGIPVILVFFHNGHSFQSKASLEAGKLLIGIDVLIYQGSVCDS